MTDLREEKRHQIREQDHTSGDVAVSLNKTTASVEKRLWMKWSVTIVTTLLGLVGWFSIDYVNRIKADAAEGPKAMTLINTHQIQANEYLKQFQEMQRDQRRLIRNVDRMTVFFETRFGMPRDARVLHHATQDTDEN